MFMRDGLHLSGKGAAVFADELSAAVDGGMGSITNIFFFQLLLYNAHVIQERFVIFIVMFRWI